MKISKTSFELRHTEPDDKPEYAVAALDGFGRLNYMRTGQSYKSSLKTWRTLAGAMKFAEQIELRPARSRRGSESPADLAVLIVDNDALPAILVVKAAEGSGLEPGQAFERDHWEFNRVDGVWDIR